jgi:hypothetical protein
MKQSVFKTLQIIGAALIAVMLSWVFFILLFSLEV